MKKILGLALAGAFLVACGSQNKQSPGMQNTTAANQEPAPAPTETNPPANPPPSEMSSSPSTTTPAPTPMPDTTQNPPPSNP